MSSRLSPAASSADRQRCARCGRHICPISPAQGGFMCGSGVLRLTASTRHTGGIVHGFRRRKSSDGSEPWDQMGRRRTPVASMESLAAETGTGANNLASADCLRQERQAASSCQRHGVHGVAAAAAGAQRLAWLPMRAAHLLGSLKSEHDLQNHSMLTHRLRAIGTDHPARLLQRLMLLQLELQPHAT